MNYYVPNMHPGSFSVFYIFFFKYETIEIYALSHCLDLRQIQVQNGSKCLPLIFVTVATDELLCDKHAVWGMGLNGFIFKKLNKKKKILRAV